jgi:ABC-type multidrug transport system fused ATPase/permease subunit
VLALNGPNLLANRPNWPENGHVEFEDVHLKYRPTTEVVLHGLSFDVQPGEKIGIVGRTGAGKSTITLAMSRIVEIFKGKISIDGVDIQNISLSKLRSSITIIPQDASMFTGTLRFNLDPEGKNSDEEIIQLLEAASLESVLLGNEKGLLQEITENGANLSSGERQLICICRAILRKGKLVVLDEATANIDMVTE